MATVEEKLEELDRRFSQLQGHSLQLRAALDESRGLAERRLRLIKKQRAYIDALVQATVAHGLSLDKPAVRQLNEIAGSDDPFVSVVLRETHGGWARGGAAVGQAFTEERHSMKVIDWETGKPPEEGTP